MPENTIKTVINYVLAIVRFIQINGDRPERSRWRCRLSPAPDTRFLIRMDFLPNQAIHRPRVVELMLDFPGYERTGRCKSIYERNT